jgi:hypothetical protein
MQTTTEKKPAAPVTKPARRLLVWAVELGADGQFYAARHLIDRDAIVSTQRHAGMGIPAASELAREDMVTQSRHMHQLAWTHGRAAEFAQQEEANLLAAVASESVPRDWDAELKAMDARIMAKREAAAQAPVAATVAGLVQMPDGKHVKEESLGPERRHFATPITTREMLVAQVGDLQTLREALRLGKEESGTSRGSAAAQRTAGLEKVRARVTALQAEAETAANAAAVSLAVRQWAR